MNSDENSKLFVYFSDHGAPGHLLFPNDVLYADELNQTLIEMRQAKKFSEMFIFLEACESGSMFHDVDLASLNIWAMTATNATAPSWGTYCYPHDTVKDQNMMTCLGDLFSVSWMEFLENNQKSLDELTFEQMYESIRQRAQEKSQVLKFGQENLA